MSESTCAKLAQALSEIPGVPREMISRAVDGYYHDFLSPLAFPEMQLVADLADLARLPATPRDSRPLLKTLRQRVIDGDFDASKEESDAWARSPEGQEAMASLLDPKEAKLCADCQAGRHSGVPHDVRGRPL